MTTDDLYTLLTACDRAKAREARRKAEAEEKLERLAELRSRIQLTLAAQREQMR